MASLHESCDAAQTQLKLTKNFLGPFSKKPQFSNHFLTIGRWHEKPFSTGLSLPTLYEESEQFYNAVLAIYNVFFSLIKTDLISYFFFTTPTAILAWRAMNKFFVALSLVMTAIIRFFLMS